MSEKFSVIELIVKNESLGKTNTELTLRLAKTTSYFMQAVVVLEDIADRFDMIEPVKGFEWVSDLTVDIEEVLALEEKLSEEFING